MAYDYETIDCDTNDGVLTATIDNPPCNVMTSSLYGDLVGFTTEVEQDDSIKVVVFQSADPDFFIAHFDVELLVAVPIGQPAERTNDLNAFHQMCTRVRTMPKATIVKMGGRTGGGGNEFSSGCDMRFGVKGKTIINQMEVALGILPGGTGTQSLPRLVGRGRAMEIVLGSDDLDAETAEKWGYLNRAFDTQEDMDNHVDKLARRIALWPAGAIAMAKQSVNNADGGWQEGLLEEAYLFQQTMRLPGTNERMRKAIELGAQTREGELRMSELCVEVAAALNPEPE
jgi:enoyl-CoA hydratase/carnithine racemase